MTGGAPADSSRGALSGVTVLELGSYAAGPAIGKYLANFGARVIHVESTSRPDGFRLQYPPYKDGVVGVNRSGCFAYFNDSKQGVTIDLKKPEGVALVLRMMPRVDVLIENMRPGVLHRLGLSYAAVSAANEKLVMLSTSNLGQTGPRAMHPGFGSQLSSLSGFTELIGAPDGPPNPLYGPYIDMIAVAFGATVILAALDRQRRTGRGAYIDLAQYEAGLQFVAPALLDYAGAGVSLHRDGNRDRVAVPHGCYPCRDERWIVLSCWCDGEWKRLVQAVGDPWLQQPALQTVDGRREREAELNERLSAWTRGRDSRELLALLRSAQLHAAQVNTMRDLFDDPQLAARKAWQTRDHPELGPMRYRMPSYQLSATPGGVRAAAPCLGEHNEAVFKGWLGLSDEEYQTLAAAGVFA